MKNWAIIVWYSSNMTKCICPKLFGVFLKNDEGGCNQIEEKSRARSDTNTNTIKDEIKKPM